VGEDPALSQPARIDVSRLLARPVAAVTELSLTAAMRRDQMPRHRAWHVEPLPRQLHDDGDEEEDGDAGFGGEGGVGGARGGLQRRGGGGAGRRGKAAAVRDWGGRVMGTNGQQQQQQQQQRVAESYNVWSHPDDAPPVFVLYPMEIRWVGWEVPPGGGQGGRGDRASFEGGYGSACVHVG